MDLTFFSENVISVKLSFLSEKFISVTLSFTVLLKSPFGLEFPVTRLAPTIAIALKNSLFFILSRVLLTVLITRVIGIFFLFRRIFLVAAPLIIVLCLFMHSSPVSAETKFITIATLMPPVIQRSQMLMKAVLLTELSFADFALVHVVRVILVLMKLEHLIETSITEITFKAHLNKN